MPYILVTGGAGYIGSHTCKVLANCGYQPVVYDSLEFGFQEFVKWGPLELGNTLDEARLAAVVKKYKPAAVIHLAAYISVGESVYDPHKYYQNNTLGSLTLLKVLSQLGVKRLVFSSTAAVYGNPSSTTPIEESHTLAPINPYARSKLLVEKMLPDFQSAHGIESVALRYFNAAGADHDGELGECHDPETHLIPLAIRAALGRGAPLTIFGQDYTTSDGTPIRDYVHVSDLADAHIKAVDYLLQDGKSTILNLGVGRGYSVRAVLDSVERILQKPIPIITGPRRSGDPICLVADASRAKSILSWSPRTRDLDTIVETAAHWEIKRDCQIKQSG